MIMPPKLLQKLAWSAVILLALAGTMFGQPLKSQEKAPKKETIKSMQLNHVGRVRYEDKRTFLEILPQYAPALDGLAGFSHVWVLYWFHENDTPDERATLKVHPRRDPANPLTGVFATRAPVRPNLIGLTACRILKIEGNIVVVADLDARDGSPILDLKPYIPQGDSLPDAATPDWVKRIYPK